MGQVVWAPHVEGIDEYLVFVGWPADRRKLGMKYCQNRPCSLYSGHLSIIKQVESNSSEYLFQYFSNQFIYYFLSVLCLFLANKC